MLPHAPSGRVSSNDATSRPLTSAPAAIAGHLASEPLERCADKRADTTYRAAGGWGRLRIYLGYAPGAGATCALLGEGRQRAEHGADVVVARAETHGRPGPSALLAGLEVVPPARVPYRGTMAEEMDVGAVLARRPQVALVDELAHSNVPGGRHATRWQDVENLLEAGIDVISTVSIGYLDSLADVVEKITGAAHRPTVPDTVVRAAGEVELVDLAPEALCDRMARGLIYPLREAEAALGGWFRIGNLSMLRELALLWLAAKLASDPQRYRPGGHDLGSGHARERVVAGTHAGSSPLTAGQPVTHDGERRPPAATSAKDARNAGSASGLRGGNRWLGPPHSGPSSSGGGGAPTPAPPDRPPAVHPSRHRPSPGRVAVLAWRVPGEGPARCTGPGGPAWRPPFRAGSGSS